MAKVEKRKARKDYPEDGIKAGDEYYPTKPAFLMLPAPAGRRSRPCAAIGPSCKTRPLSWRDRRSASITGPWRCSARRRCPWATC